MTVTLPFRVLPFRSLPLAANLHHVVVAGRI
jgi:hypothetical protein